MKKKNALLLVLTLFLLLPTIVNADCESDFKEIEDKFKVTYEYNYETDDFTITLVNPDYNKYSYGFASLEALNATHPTISDEDGTLTHTIENYKDTEYSYVISAIYEGCKVAGIKQETIELSKGNRFAYSPLCEGYEEFVLCQKDYEKELDEETFKERLEIYKQTKAEQKEKEASEAKEKENNKILSGIIDFFQENYITIIIIAAFVIVLIISIVLFAKRYMKRRRLE